MKRTTPKPTTTTKASTTIPKRAATGQANVNAPVIAGSMMSAKATVTTPRRAVSGRACGKVSGIDRAFGIGRGSGLSVWRPARARTKGSGRWTASRVATRRR